MIMGEARIGGIGFGSWPTADPGTEAMVVRYVKDQASEGKVEANSGSPSTTPVAVKSSIDLQHWFLAGAMALGTNGCLSFRDREIEPTSRFYATAVGQDFDCYRSSVVTNPTFEIQEDESLAGWSYGNSLPIAADGSWAEMSNGGRVARSAGGASGGHWGLTLSVAGVQASEYAAAISAPLGVLAGHDYELSFSYRAKGLMRENGDRQCYTALIVDVRGRAEGKSLNVGRVMTYDNTSDWVRVRQLLRIPDETDSAQLCLQLVKNYPQSDAWVEVDDFALVPVDSPLPDGGFEAQSVSQPSGWIRVGSSGSGLREGGGRNGSKGLGVDADSASSVSGYYRDVPVRHDRRYSLEGFIRSDGIEVKGNGDGAVLSVSFMDARRNLVGARHDSTPFAGSASWESSECRELQAPMGASQARLMVWIDRAVGSAVFDDLVWRAAPVTLDGSPRWRLQKPGPDATVSYSPNLLDNGEVESGSGRHPNGWEWRGSAVPNWTASEITVYWNNGYPPFDIGRATGFWSKELTFAGGGALAIDPIEPPRSPVHQWYGHGPVDGYWMSAPMQCEPGKSYVAGGWLNARRNLAEAWFGPLELRFFNSQGIQLRAANDAVRPGLASVPAEQWTYWATLPWVAPSSAATMRLRFGHELKANQGGWGSVYADNLAVWELPQDAPVAAPNQLGLRSQAFRSWFRESHRRLKPPYVPAPEESGSYGSCWGQSDNLSSGNLYFDQTSVVPFQVRIYNLLSEPRQLKLRVVRSDWLGSQDYQLTFPLNELAGSSEASFRFDLPATGQYGAYHLDFEVLEGQAVVGRFAGRYAVLPDLKRPRTTGPRWGVTPLVKLMADGSAYERQLAYLLKVGGFSVAWVRLYFKPDQHAATASVEQLGRLLDWYKEGGIDCVVQLIPQYERGVSETQWRACGRQIGEMLRAKVLAYGNWGIETANTASPFRGGGPDRMTDQEYDAVALALGLGLREADPNAKVLIGNIATDWMAATLERMYLQPVSGQFDGAILNSYLGIHMTVTNHLNALDRHGDHDKELWLEETAEQRAPWDGAARRYGEGDGTRQMVRVWASLAAVAHPRLKTVTTWGFVTDDSSDVMMVTPDLQPRPQFVAHAVMADALADAVYVRDRSVDEITLLEWRRSDGPLFVVWANAGEGHLQFRTTAHQIQVMDLMGNRTEVSSINGIAKVAVDITPIYVSAASSVVEGP
jgi:hypothetical protein